MRLTGENRAIVSLGLSRLRTAARPGLRALLHEAGLDERPLTSVTVGYTLAVSYTHLDVYKRQSLWGCGHCGHEHCQPG